MVQHSDNPNNNAGEKHTLSGSTGNASNPNPNDEMPLPEGNSQLLDEKAEKYLREVASIEDLPDAQDQQEMDKVIEEEKE